MTVGDGGTEQQARVAWVTGASRGVGRGIAVALGRAGWTVYVSARSSSSGGSTSHLPGTVEDAAAAVTDAGGRGVPIVCDHRDDDAVRTAADRIRDEQGRLDLLVNNAWAGYERLNAGAWEEWNAPMWEQPIELFDAMFTGGVRCHYVALVACAPLLIESPGSVVVTVSFTLPGTSRPADEASTTAPDPAPAQVAYGMAKTADDRLAEFSATQLRPRGVASVALHPGLVRTEGVMQFAEYFDLASSQSPEGVGRVVVALADDPDVLTLNGQALEVAALADAYGVDIAT